ncbi:hypothetical protein ACIA8K_20030 [Catenuloplanes sp. NPDC051500]|uniref:hypothetical protein n=1 Tax=Catenuloplanes sp. NPDC051500 TaxID=3363959 RepID=UPI0037AFBFC4
MISSSSAWATIRPLRTLLVVVRTGVTLTRLLDVLTLTAGDKRIQTYFTYDPDNPPNFAAGTPGFLDRLEAPLIPWPDAVSRRFDLALAASENDRLHELDAPILLVPHGLGFHKYYPGSTTISGMDPSRLVHDGRVVPAAIALTHPAELAVLAAACPPAVPRAVVVGDPCLDRMIAGRHRVPLYRAALGAHARTLVVLASTWGPDGLWGRFPDLLEVLAATLPADEFAVAAILHPGIWSAHGPWQVRAWLERAAAAGLRIVSPEDGWQATLSAADLVVSDAGSLSLYAALLGRPLLLAGGGPTVVPGSAMERLLASAPRLSPASDLLEQVQEALRATAPRLSPASDLPEQVQEALRATAPPLSPASDLPEQVQEALRATAPPLSPASDLPKQVRDALRATAPPPSPASDLLEQVREALRAVGDDAAGARFPPASDRLRDPVPAGVVDAPGACAERLRPLIYRLLDLPEPPSPGVLPPPSMPVSPGTPIPALVVDALITDGVASVRRFPAFIDAPPGRGDRDYRHVVAEVATAAYGRLGGAAVLRADVTASLDRWRRDAGVLLAEWPVAALVTGVDAEERCHVVTRSGDAWTLAADVDDPGVLASLVYLHLKDPGVRLDALRLGDRLVPVSAERR